MGILFVYSVDLHYLVISVTGYDAHINNIVGRTVFSIYRTMNNKRKSYLLTIYIKYSVSTVNEEQ